MSTTVSPARSATTTPTRPQRLRRAVVAVLLGTTVLTGPALTGWAASHAQAVPPVAVQTDLAPRSFADLAAAVSPAVVNIAATQEAKPTANAQRRVPGVPMFPPGSPFEEFFRRFQDQQGPNAGPDDDEDGAPRGKTGALGSGFIIDPAGYVVTNNHVIDGASEITVTLQDGTAFPATLVGRDAKTDIALLKVKSDKPLPAVDWADSAKTRVGDWVMAVGNPFGLGGTVTKGIVSARGRDIHSGPYDDYFQLDAAINRGNSGGPTFDLSGRVIGINTAIYSPNGGSVGIGFAIPSNLAKEVVAQLKENGKVERGWLGVKIQEVTPDLADSVGVPNAKGALVAEVTPDSPAARAGLRPGDVVVSYDGKPVDTLRDLTRRVADTKAGDKVDVKIIRQGQEKTVAVHIDRLADTQVAANTGKGEHGAGGESVQGLKLATLDPATRKRLGVDETVKGVVVTGLAPKTETPIRTGDIIVRVGDEPVKTPADVSRKVAEAEKAGLKAVLVLINRQGNETFVALKLKA
ncbi:DegQ family serine endoprotease [Azospirillum griseum]|uniref:Probable periplasmic serine endoprotease DegP-like n=1 Tax=Azospirillum griseum TaxID=2496639 RepID=A0A3S0IEE4_9PROT|nr:DegQ family serine endoprotease [Azospirillum griseum]RTR19140.1 Do family serine endopeptidase [Azospirillum griseum]